MCIGCKIKTMLANTSLTATQQEIIQREVNQLVRGAHIMVDIIQAAQSRSRCFTDHEHNTVQRIVDSLLNKRDQPDPEARVNIDDAFAHKLAEMLGVEVKIHHVSSPEELEAVLKSIDAENAANESKDQTKH